MTIKKSEHCIYAFMCWHGLKCSPKLFKVQTKGEL